mgnify:CR=1 FL=1
MYLHRLHSLVIFIGFFLQHKYNIMNIRFLAKTAGISYIVIFFAAIFANFFVLEALLATPLETVQNNEITVRFGIVAFLLTVFFDVIVAWALFEMYKEHVFTRLSTYLRIMHAAIMGAAIFALPLALKATTADAILHQVEAFNNMWLIGLFFFGGHLILLARIAKPPKWIMIFLTLAGIMYMVDTVAHFIMPNYSEYADVFLMLVAIPSILGEMAFAIWLLLKAGK